MKVNKAWLSKILWFSSLLEGKLPSNKDENHRILLNQALDEWWMMKDEGWRDWLKAVWKFCFRTDKQTNEQTNGQTFMIVESLLWLKTSNHVWESHQMSPLSIKQKCWFHWMC